MKKTLTLYTTLFICCFVCTNKTIFPMHNRTCTPSEAYLKYFINCTTKSGKHFFGQVNSSTSTNDWRKWYKKKSPNTKNTEYSHTIGVDLRLEEACQKLLPLLILMLSYAKTKCSLSLSTPENRTIWNKELRGQFNFKVYTSVLKVGCEERYYPTISPTKKKKHKKMIFNHLKRAVQRKKNRERFYKTRRYKTKRRYYKNNKR